MNALEVVFVSTSKNLFIIREFVKKQHMKRECVRREIVKQSHFVERKMFV